LNAAASSEKNGIDHSPGSSMKPSRLTYSAATIFLAISEFLLILGLSCGRVLRWEVKVPCWELWWLLAMHMRDSGGHRSFVFADSIASKTAEGGVKVNDIVGLDKSRRVGCLRSHRAAVSDTTLMRVGTRVQVSDRAARCCHLLPTARHQEGQR
jgi:hypothetical protein